MRSILMFLTFLALLLPAVVSAQFYKVYGYETTEKGETEVVLWNSYVAQSEGELAYFDKLVDRDGLWAHSLEIEHGFTERLTLAARVDFLDPQEGDFEYVRFKTIFFHYRFGEPGGSLFDPAILLEYSLPRANYPESEELELRLILERKLGKKMILRLNPIFAMATSGHEVQEGLEFEYAAGIYFNASHSVQPGLEIYGEMGELRDPEPFDKQGLFLFPTVNLHIWELHWNLGVGFGLTEESDDFTVKSILAYGF